MHIAVNCLKDDLFNYTLFPCSVFYTFYILNTQIMLPWLAVFVIPQFVMMVLLSTMQEYSAVNQSVTV